MTDADTVDLLRSLRTPRFAPALAQFARKDCADGFIVVLEVFEHKRPEILYSSQPNNSAGRDGDTTPLASVGDSPRSDRLLFWDCTTDQVRFLNSYTKETDLQHTIYWAILEPFEPADIAFFVTSSGRSSRFVIALGRSRPALPFTQDEEDRCSALAPGLCALVRAHWEFPTPTSSHEKIVNSALSQFGLDILTVREREVVRRILLGRSSKAIAFELNISDPTAKVHRRNAYAKLRIRSQAELFSKFLRFLSRGTPELRPTTPEYLGVISFEPDVNEHLS